MSNTQNENGKPAKKSLFVRIIRWFVLIPILLLAICIAGASAGYVVLGECSKDLPNVEKLKFYSPSETTKIFSVDGKVLATLFKENREWAPYKKIPKEMINAIIAIEDSRFYEHHGVSIPDIVRAVYIDFRHQGYSQGASTITQQLARNIFLHPSANLRRKVREALLAIEIEKKFTKREILELYLNQIYFGGGAYGVQAAAKTYFNKDISQLDVARCAVLAGLPAAPSVYSPFSDPKLARQRQIMVLKRMCDLGFIDYHEMKKAIDEDIPYAKKKSEFKGDLKYPYFTTYAMHELFQKYSDDLLYRGGLKVYTTLDTRIQNYAEKAVKDGLSRADAQGLNCHQVALVAVEPSTGFIRAMIGGTGWSDKNQFNRAWQARRQPGSAFKIFVYTTAIDSGYTPESVVLDSPVSYPDGIGQYWSPKNSDGKFWGAITIRRAIQWSRNVAAVRMISALGPEKVIQYAYKMGIKDKLEPTLSLALGAAVVTPLDMTSAVSVLANEGVRVEPTAIKKIIDSEGNIIEDNTFPSREVVLPASTAYSMADMMQGVINGGTATNAQIGRPAAGKTGTTDSFRDAWFVGFTPQLACSIWTGNDDYSQMNYAFGGNIPASIWAAFMKKALQGKPVQQFRKPQSDLAGVLICDESGLLATAGCPKTHKEFFKYGKAPTRRCDIHGYGEGSNSSGEKNEAPRKEKAPAASRPEVHEEDLAAPEENKEPPKTEQHQPAEPEIGQPEKPATQEKEQPPAPQGEVDL